MVKNLPCIAGDVGLIPGWETKLPHATEQLLKPREPQLDSLQHKEGNHMTQPISQVQRLRPEAAKEINMKKKKKEKGYRIFLGHVCI